MEKIAIIGTGISGMAVLNSYEKEVDKDLYQIDCYDSKESHGRGYPFRKDSDHAILNVKPKLINYDYEDSNDFTSWLKDSPYEHNEFVPRHVLGEYLRENFLKSVDLTGSNIIQEKVFNLEYIYKDKKWKLITKTGKENYYDRVHLCNGELPQGDFYNLKDYPNYLNEIYPLEETLKDLSENSTYCIIGTSLSAIDVARYLLMEKNPEKIYIFSRSNTFPSIRVQTRELDLKYFNLENCKKIIGENNNYISFNQVEDLIQRELVHHGTSYENLIGKFDQSFETIINSSPEDEDLIIGQSIFRKTPKVVNLVWQHMKNEDKNLFSKKYMYLINIFFGPIPRETGELLIKYYNKGIFQVVDNVNDIEYDQENRVFNILVDNEIYSQAKYTINATGLDKSLRSSKSTDNLIGNMLNNRIIRVDDFKGITVLDGDFSVLSPKYGNLKTLHSYGMLISGVQIQNNSISTIQASCHDVIKKIY